MKKRISQSTYDLLIDRKHAVPRDGANYIQIGWKVGKEYEVFVNQTTEPIKVRCTQDCPFHLQVIQ